MNSPCKNCDERNMVCHCTCVKYKEFVEQNEIRKKKNRIKMEEVQAIKEHYAVVRREYRRRMWKK